MIWLAGAPLAGAGQLAEVEIVDSSTGLRLESWHHEGRRYVVGKPGGRYAVRLANRSNGRVLAVLSVDGVNAITGETASAGQSGYVLAPRQSTVVRGWRKSLEDVAAFHFTALPDAYAARTGRPDHVGVVGVALFREYVAPQPAPLQKQAPATAADAAGGVRERSEGERLGTGHGERLHDPARYADFRRADERPAGIVSIYYDSRENLLARGIIPRQPHRAHPQPFPAGFVPDPS
ncbi:MAG: hypothetical protein F9K21_05870 [Rhodocyclaceae bacterium]|nr:MAG: hypothetical protein F9K21_05870 [Rhodocyclaceae bacterium]MCK6385593.1 hypothetical protein [Rhodocyclaceae bacterium]